MAFGLFERGIPVLLHLIEEIQRRAVHAILLLPQGDVYKRQILKHSLPQK